MGLMAVVLFAGCQTAYYATMAKFGYEKRDLLVRAVQLTRDEQKKAGQEFKDAMTRLKELYAFNGGDLERQYTRLKSDFDTCDSQAQTVRKRITDMDTVARDLFAEWNQEISTMSNGALASDSRTKLAETKSRYSTVSTSLHASESTMEPVLRQFRDHVLYLKHNLNAAAIGSLKGEASNIQTDIGRLLDQMNRSIAEADAFVKTLKGRQFQQRGQSHLLVNFTLIPVAQLLNGSRMARTLRVQYPGVIYRDERIVIFDL